MSLKNFKGIGNSLNTNEFNGLISLYRKFKSHSENLEINDVIISDFGKYEFDIEDTTILDTGILITNETISAEPKVRLSDALFSNSTYTLVLNVLHYTGVNILDDITPSNYKVIDTVEVELTPNTWIDIPVTNISQGYIISFDASVKITHDKTVIQGNWINTFTLTTNKQTINTGETATLTATLLDRFDEPMKNETVIFKNGSTTLDTVTTGDTGTATYTYTGTGAGNITITANVGTNSRSVSIVDGNLTPSTISLSASQASVTYGDSVVLSGTLNSESGKSVKIYQGDTLLDTVSTGSSGAFTKTVTGLAVGSYTFKAVFEGDSTYASATSSNVSVTVNKITSTISLSVASASVVYGNNVALSGTLSVGSGESVKIYQGDTLIDTVTTGTGGAFSKSVSGLSAGSYTFKATYEGDATHTNVTSSTVSATVTKATPTISLSSSSATVTVNTSFTLSGTLSVGAGKSVKIYDGSTLLDTVTSGTGGAFSKSLSVATAGSKTYKATYEGDNNYNSVTSSDVSVTIQDVTPSFDGITVSSTKDILSYADGDSATISAQLMDGQSAASVSGETVTFTFMHGTTAVETQTATTNASGIATVSYSSKGTGDLNIQVECMSVTETYAIEDTTFYDNASSNKISNYTATNTTVTYDSDHYVAESGTTTSASDYLGFVQPTGITLPSDFSLSCDIKCASESQVRAIWGLIFIDAITIASGSQKSVEMGDFNNAKGICYRTPSFDSTYRVSGGLSTNTWYNMKLDFNGTSVTGTIKQGSTTVYSQTATLSVVSNLNYVAVYQADAKTTIHWKNLKIKPIV